jgi:hypothetical protein
VERRRSQRLTLHRPVAGEISVMQDVVVEQLNATEVTVITTIPIARGEQMLLHVEDGQGTGLTLVVRGLERRPVVMDGHMRHRVRLRIVRTEVDEAA